MFTPTFENYNLQGRHCPLCDKPFQLVPTYEGGGWECDCGISRYPVCLHCGHALYYSEDIGGREYVHCPQCDIAVQYGHYTYGVAPSNQNDLVLYVLVQSFAFDEPNVFVFLSEEEREEKAIEIAMEYATDVRRGETITVQQAFEIYENDETYEGMYYYQIPVSKSRVLGLLKGGSDA